MQSIGFNIDTFHLIPSLLPLHTFTFHLYYSYYPLHHCTFVHPVTTHNPFSILHMAKLLDTDTHYNASHHLSFDYIHPTFWISYLLCSYWTSHLPNSFSMKSSAYSSSQQFNLLIMLQVGIIIKSTGLCIDPRCTLTCITNSSLSRQLNLKLILKPLYTFILNCTSQSSILIFLSVHQTTYQCIPSRAFSMSVDTKCSCYLLPKKFDWNCLTINIELVVSLYGTKPSCTASMSILSLIIFPPLSFMTLIVLGLYSYVWVHCSSPFTHTQLHSSASYPEQCLRLW